MHIIKIHTKRLTIFLLVLFNFSIAQSQCRYRDSIFSAANSVNQVYGYNTNFGVLDSLRMHMYQPVGDVKTSRPAILLIHGGGFNTGNYDDPRVLEMCRRFAIRGYVAASVQYRLYTNSPLNYPAAIYKAMQDVKAAVRFIRGNAVTYGVDAQKIFLHGFSAGAFIGNHAAYWDYPEVADALKTTYGNFEASGNPGIADTVSGVMSWAGGIMDTSWLDNENVPWGSAHNFLDPVVPFWGSTGNYGSGFINQYRQNHSLASSLYRVDIPGLHTPDVGTNEYNNFSSYSIEFIYNLLQIACSGFPVSLSDFNAESANSSVLLKWTTLSEINSSHFNVERSIDGINFNVIGHIKAAGNSNLPIQYSFKDGYPSDGKNYYRLQQVDKDNSKVHSKTVSVAFNSPSFFKLIANPVRNKLLLQLRYLPSTGAAWRMYSITGRVIFSERVNNAFIEKNIESLPKGMYTIEIVAPGQRDCLKILKE